MKALKWGLGGAGVLILLAVAVTAYVAATFDPNAYKPRLVELVKQRTGRTLTINGTIRLTYFPKIGATLGQVTLSEPNDPRTFARIGDARVAVALWPLLSRQVIVERVMLTGLAVDLVRHRDGRTNFDDLAGHGGQAPKPAERPHTASGGSPLAIDVGGITLEDATIGWRDEGAGTNVRFSNVDLRTGRLASGVPGRLTLAARVVSEQPKADLKLDVDTGYQLDFATLAAALSSLDVKAVGDAPGLRGLDARLKGSTVDVDPRAPRITLSRVDLTATSKDGLDAKLAIPRLQLTPDQADSQTVTGDLKLASPERTVTARLEVPPFAAKGQQLQLSGLRVELTAKQGDLAVQGKLATPVTLDLQQRKAQLPQIAGDLTVSGPSIPNRSTTAAVTGAAQADWGAQNANADLAVKLDQSNVAARVGVAHWSQPAITFNVVADRLDVDRYLPPSKPAGRQGDGPPAGSGTAGGGPEQPFDLSPLRTLNATGDVKIGALQVMNVKAEQVALSLKAAGGRVDVHPVSADLYEGKLTGSVAVDAKDNRVAVKQQLARVSVGPLLRDAASKDLIEGKGDVVVDVQSAGTTVTQLKQGLAGTTRLALRDGAIKGIDIAGTIRTAKAALGAKGAIEQQAQGGARTDFSDLTATFAIKNGVAHNDDLHARSPLLRLAGRGDIDIGRGTIDYTAKASVVATATGQGGKDLAQLSGVTVPVRATGPLADVKYGVDVQALATGAVKDTLQRELERRLGGDSGGQPKGGAGGVGESLRGLFGK